ncbi:PLP-dependent lyase/thiolase [Rhodobacterales bacterium 52_120_T64]|nr:PLP-dependent lyase/thiolase [Rhodobacterales bacterium 52_120_T64]
MELLSNILNGNGLQNETGMAYGEVCSDPTAARALFAKCPIAAVSPLVDAKDLAKHMGVAEIHVKDERVRLGLGSFKALGAAFAIAKAADKLIAKNSQLDPSAALSGQVYVCASAGNHGLSMAAGARIFGADAVVYLSKTVPEEFAERLTAKGATVIRAGENYEASMEAAIKAADQNGWTLLSDSSWEGYAELPRDVMEGYLIMGAEVADQLSQPPTHIFLQAGVGGLAAACTAAARYYWGDGPKVFVVEPEYAPALFDSIEASKAVTTKGPVSNMGRLDCKEPSHLALKYLAKEADGFITVRETEAIAAMEDLKTHGLAASPSAAAGYAGLCCAGGKSQEMGLTADSRILIYLSEGPVDE